MSNLTPSNVRVLHRSPNKLLSEMFAYHEFFSQKILGLDSKEYAREYWRNAYKYGRTIGHLPRTWRNLGVSSTGGPGAWSGHESAVLWAAFMELCGVPFWLLARLIDTNVRKLLRPKYYDAENARRREFRRANRRIIRRTTTAPCPTRAELLDAFAHAKDSPEQLIRFGSLINDLECFVDNSLKFDASGKIVGRRGGIRAYLLDHVPELFDKYKTVMRYRGLARNFRRACKAHDPVPAAALLPEPTPKKSTQSAATAPAPHKKIPPTYSQKIAQEILADCRQTIVSLSDAIETRLKQREDEFARAGLPPEPTRRRLFAAWERTFGPGEECSQGVQILRT